MGFMDCFVTPFLAMTVIANEVWRSTLYLWIASFC